MSPSVWLVENRSTVRCICCRWTLYPKSTLNQSELVQRTRNFAEWPLDMYHSVGYVCIALHSVIMLNRNRWWFFKSNLYKELMVYCVNKCDYFHLFAFAILIWLNIDKMSFLSYTSISRHKFLNTVKIWFYEFYHWLAKQLCRPICSFSGRKKNLYHSQYGSIQIPMRQLFSKTAAAQRKTIDARILTTL